MFRDKVFLASQSPRRRELIGYLFESPQILRVSFDEARWLDGEPPLEYLDRCVAGKWEEAQANWASQASPGDGLLVADTIVALDGRVLGKPVNTRDAERMLAKLSGAWHTVFTGFRLGRRGEESKRGHDVVIVETSVKFRKVSPAEIRAYVRTGEPMDKAGSYGLQERGLGFVEAIRGPYSNVVGLPIERLRREAERLGFR